MSIVSQYIAQIMKNSGLGKSLVVATDAEINTSDQLSLENIREFLAIAVQLGLLVLVIRQFQLISLPFYHYVTLLTFFGFVIHYFLPTNLRIPFYLFLSLVGIATIFGFQNGAWMVGIGLVLIGICHIRISFYIRVLILLLLGIVLAFLRVGSFPTPWSETIWPVLASFFMFRLIVYMYDLHHQKAPVNPWQTLSYFFLLPNVALPFFPVVDYSTFKRTYFNDDQFNIYRSGIKWMFIGIIHLILYRFVNYYLIIPAEDVLTVPDLFRYLISNFLLYLRVSGQFHLIVGMLQIFGFNLPRTNDNYMLSSSFTDFWRRINIYWKDFMMKIFYYPTYFRIREWGTTKALILSTLFVFFVTWFLHAYQWFWLKGTFLLSLVDILFWTILAFLVLGNVLYESKYGRKRTLGKQKRSLRDSILHALRIIGTMTTIIVLWSLWTSSSISEWLSLWSVLEISRESFIVVLFLFLLIIVIANVVYLKKRLQPEQISETQ